MVRYLGPKLHVIRRLRNSQIGTLKKPLSAYGERLEEKQKVRFNYGLTNRQLKTYLEVTQRMPGPSGINLLMLLEMRLDATLFRIGVSSSIQQGRQ